MELEGFGLNSLTDFPLVTPSQFAYKISSVEGLQIVRQIILSYFDIYLKGKVIDITNAKLKLEIY